jgi:hypothetical protein
MPKNLPFLMALRIRIPRVALSSHCQRRIANQCSPIYISISVMVKEWSAGKSEYVLAQFIFRSKENRAIHMLTAQMLLGLPCGPSSLGPF